MQFARAQRLPFREQKLVLPTGGGSAGEAILQQMNDQGLKTPGISCCGTLEWFVLF